MPGVDAIPEVARLLAPGGQLALLMHCQNGAIQRECTQNLDAIQAMQTAEFLPRSQAMLTAAYATLDSDDKSAYAKAGKALAPAIAAMEAIMQEHGRDVAAGTLVRVYRDVRTIHSELHRYDKDDVVDWLQRMQTEVEAYAGRMQSMAAAAISRETFDSLCNDLSANGFTLSRNDAFTIADSDLPLAWVLVATKS